MAEEAQQPAAPAAPEQPAAPEAPAAPETPAAPVEAALAEAPAAPAAPEPAPNPIETFKQKYQALVQETGHSINVEPKYIKRDDGSYSTVLETTILPVR